MSMDAIIAKEQANLIEAMGVFHLQKDAARKTINSINERANPFPPEEGTILTMDQLMEKLNNV